jgi:serine/threonine-protein kinase
VVIWELLTGKRLFVADSPAALVHKVLNDKIEPPSKFGAPAELDAVVLEGLAMDPAARFANARAMAKALESAAAPASKRAISEWLESVVGDKLRERAALVEAMEQSPAEELSSGSLRAFVELPPSDLESGTRSSPSSPFIAAPPISKPVPPPVPPSSRSRIGPPTSSNPHPLAPSSGSFPSVDAARPSPSFLSFVRTFRDAPWDARKVAIVVAPLVLSSLLVSAIIVATMRTSQTGPSSAASAASASTAPAVSALPATAATATVPVPVPAPTKTPTPTPTPDETATETETDPLALTAAPPATSNDPPPTRATATKRPAGHPSKPEPTPKPGSTHKGRPDFGAGPW